MYVVSSIFNRSCIFALKVVGTVRSAKFVRGACSLTLNG